MTHCFSSWLTSLTSLHARSGVPNEIRTRVTAVKGRCPKPLDDGNNLLPFFFFIFLFASAFAFYFLAFASAFFPATQ